MLLLIYDTPESEILNFFDVSTVTEFHLLLDHLMNSDVIYLWDVGIEGDCFIIFEPSNSMLEPGWRR